VKNKLDEKKTLDEWMGVVDAAIGRARRMMPGMILHRVDLLDLDQLTNRGGLSVRSKEPRDGSDRCVNVPFDQVVCSDEEFDEWLLAKEVPVK